MRPTRYVHEHPEPTLDQDKRDDDFGKRFVHGPEPVADPLTRRSSTNELVGLKHASTTGELTVSGARPCGRRSLLLTPLLP
jgi:hypothetical protein